MAKNHCENCLYFDNEKMQNDKRTETAGICKKWHEVTFKSTKSCKSFETPINQIEVVQPTYVYSSQMTIFDVLNL